QLSLALELGDAERIARARTTLGLLAARSGNPDDAEASFLAAREIYQRLGRTTEAARVEAERARLLLQRDRLAEASEMLREAQEVFEASASDRDRSANLELQAEVRLREGELTEARRLLAQAENLPGGRPHAASSFEETQVPLLAARIALEAGDLPEARRRLEEAADEGFQKKANPARAAESLLLRGRLLLAEGRRDLARQELESAVEAAASEEEPALAAEALAARSELALDAGNFLEAAALARASLERDPSASEPHLRARALFLLGRAQWHLARPAEAARTLRDLEALAAGRETAGISLDARLLAAVLGTGDFGPLLEDLDSTELVARSLEARWLAAVSAASRGDEDALRLHADTLRDRSQHLGFQRYLDLLSGLETEPEKTLRVPS
ncbi:MAG: tetratricopeptide repeat protein, partial [Acidobacteria bacterium]|nr:tetratricopeptide repeat protein [Acidobacteriota bacterium]